MSDAGGRPGASLRRTVDDAQQRSEPQGDAGAKPRVDLLPRPPIHADLTSLRTLAAADEDRAALAIEITFGQRQRFLMGN